MAGHHLPIQPAQAEFLISRAGESAYERQLAQWITERLIAVGHVATAPGPSITHQDLMSAMLRVATGEARIIALLSRAFLASLECLAQAAAALAGDPVNASGRLILLRIEDVQPAGVLAGLAVHDMVALRHDSARFEAGLLAAIAAPVTVTKRDAAPAAPAEAAANGASRPVPQAEPAGAAPATDPLAAAIATVAFAAEAVARAALAAERKRSS